MTSGDPPRGGPGEGGPPRGGLGEGGPGTAGQVEHRFESVAEAFASLVDAQPGTGAALCIHVQGAPVVDLWGGWADEARTRPWERDSIVQPYSVSKPVAASAALHLVDAGRLELDAPVQRYWPEFTPAATIRHVLSHQAGVVALDEPGDGPPDDTELRYDTESHYDTELLYDWDRLCAILARQEPSWVPGTAHGESALFYGHLVGEVVRRVDGRSLGTYVREEICGPLGIDFAFGLTPGEQIRAIDLTHLETIRGPESLEGRPDLYRRAVTNPPGAREAAVVNGARWRATEFPAINGHGSARGLATFYQALLDGRILGPDLLAEAIRPQCTGPDRVLGWDNSWGLGFGVDADDWGMGGLGGSYAGVNTQGGYVLAFVTGSMGTSDRVSPLENELRSVLRLPPLET